MDKEYAARNIFALPVEQILTYDELTPEQKDEAAYIFGAGIRGYAAYLYAVKKDSGLVSKRV